MGPEPQCAATWISIDLTPRDRWSGGQATKVGVLVMASEPGTVGLCGPALLWTTCWTTYVDGTPARWSETKAVIAEPMSAMRTKLPFVVITAEDCFKPYRQPGTFSKNA